MNREKLEELLNDYDIGLLLMDGFDEAFLGWGTRVGEEPIAVYDRNKMIDILVEGSDLSYEDADEYITFNCEGGWVGPRTPLIITLVADLYDPDTAG